MRMETVTSLLLAGTLVSGCSSQNTPADSKPAAAIEATTPGAPAATQGAAPATQGVPAPTPSQPAQRPPAMTAPAPSVQAPPATPASAAPATTVSPGAPTGSTAAAPAPAVDSFREVTIPEGTVLTVVLETSHASDTAQVEDRVNGRLAAPVVVGGVAALAEGADVTGRVIDAKPSGRVKGRASLTLRFTEIEARDGETAAMRSASVSRLAPSEKKKDAVTIGGSAAGGAVAGAIVGGKKGAAIGAIVGGAGGTGVVLATKGDEVGLSAGQTVKVRLTAPLTVRVPEGR